MRVAKEIYETETHVTTPVVPRLANLNQNYPNPFPNPSNPSTTIIFDLTDKANVIVEVYNVIGQRVATLADRAYEPGSYPLTFAAANLASGVYFVRIVAVSKTATYVQSRKMVVLK